MSTSIYQNNTFIDRSVALNLSEEPALFKWVQAEGYLQIIQLSEFNAGDFAKAAETALATSWKKPPTASNGAEIAAKLLANYLK